MSSLFHVLATTVLLLSLPALTTATASAPNPLLRAQLSLFHPFNPLQARSPQEVCDGIDCGEFCVPSGYHCCSDGGAGCPIGSDCIPNGCCPSGETCDGGGGTLTFPGGVGGGAAATSFNSPASTDDAFSSDSFSLIDATTTHTTRTGKGAAATSQNAYDSYLATATAGGGAAASSIEFPSFSSPTFALSAASLSTFSVPSQTGLRSGGGDSGGGSSGGSSSGGAVPGGAGRVGGEVYVNACLIVAGLLAVWVV